MIVTWEGGAVSVMVRILSRDSLFEHCRGNVLLRRSSKSCGAAEKQKKWLLGAKKGRRIQSSEM